MHIQMPSEAEKRRSIQFILDEGMPQKEPLHRVISRLIHTIGLRNLFWGTWDCIFLALLGGLTLVILFVIPSAVQTQLLPLGLLLISPAVYGLLHGLTVWKERQVGLYELKLTCCYTLKELTALRMVFFGGGSVLLDVLFVLCLRQTGTVLSFLQMLGISLSALFLYGTATLLVFAHSKSQWSVPAVWCGLCVAPLVLRVDLLEWLLRIPAAVAMVVAGLSVLLFFAQLEHYLSANHEGGVSYAVS